MDAELIRVPVEVNMRSLPRSLVVMVGLALPALASAGTSYMQLHCWAQTKTNPVIPPGTVSPAFSAWAIAETADTSNQANAYLFEDSAEEEIQCSFIVPGDHDSSSETISQIWAYGFTTASQTCSSGSVNVVFEVSNRFYRDDLLFDDAWSGTDSGLFVLPCITNGCGVGINCHQRDRIYGFQADVGSELEGWQPFDLVFIRIQRADGDSSTKDAYVTNVMLQYPDTN